MQSSCIVLEYSLDRSKLPELGTPKSSSFPAIQRETLSNGLTIVLAERKGVSTIVADMMFNAGYKTDIKSKAGIASLAMNLMDEGTKDLTSLEINEKLQLLGANLSTSSDQDISRVSLNTLKPSFDASINLFANVILIISMVFNPVYVNNLQYSYKIFKHYIYIVNS